MDLNYLIHHIKTAILDAFINKSNLIDEIINIEQNNGNKCLHLYNNICNIDHKAAYLEVGTNNGSSLVAALFHNTNVDAICIDNWSETQRNTNEMVGNIKNFLGKIQAIKVFDKNPWNITDIDIIKPVVIFHYNGDIGYEVNKQAITYYYKFFSKYVILIIDNWRKNNGEVKNGTLDGLQEMNLKIHYSFEIPIINSDDFDCAGDTFWNGCGIFICEKLTSV